jgi:hypothetical protein
MQSNSFGLFAIGTIGFMQHAICSAYSLSGHGEEETYVYIVTSSVSMPAMGCMDDPKATDLTLLPITWVPAPSALFAAVQIIMRLNTMPITFQFYITPSATAQCQ